jgi:hypothetical protein
MTIHFPASLPAEYDAAERDVIVRVNLNRWPVRWQFIDEIDYSLDGETVEVDPDSDLWRALEAAAWEHIRSRKEAKP